MDYLNVTDEQLQQRANIGDQMYNVVEFDGTDYESSHAAVHFAMIESWLKSGMALEDLEPAELELFTKFRQQRRQQQVLLTVA